MTADREQVRTVFSAALAGVLRTAQQVFDHEPDDFLMISPAVTVLSMGSFTPRLTTRGTRSEFDFDVRFWVLLRDDTTAYDPEEAEKTLDSLFKNFSEWLQDTSSQENGTWRTLDLRESTKTGFAVIAGREYRVETIPVRIGVF